MIKRRMQMDFCMSHTVERTHLGADAAVALLYFVYILLRFNQQNIPYQGVLVAVHKHLEDFREANSIERLNVVPSIIQIGRWLPAPQSIIKLNVDAEVDRNRNGCY